MTKDVIASIQSQLAKIETGVDDDTAAVAGSGGFNKRISIKAGVFRKIVGGKEVGTIEDRHMNIIFVKLAHEPSRTYYDKPFREGVKTSPVCWSTDAKTPDEDVEHPQAAACDKCQWSVKGTGQNGQGTACRLSWRTAVVLPNDPAGDVLQLVLPAASCFGKEESGRYPFRPYIQMLAANNISAGRVVTRMSFDTSANMPRVLFQPAAAVAEEDVETIKQQAVSVAAENAVKLTVYQTDKDGDDEDEAEAPAAEMPEESEEEVESEDEAKSEDEAPFEVEEVKEVKVKKSSKKAAEPKLRSTAKEKPAEKDVSEVIKRWSSRKA